MTLGVPTDARRQRRLNIYPGDLLSQDFQQKMSKGNSFDTWRVLVPSHVFKL